MSMIIYLIFLKKSKKSTILNFPFNSWITPKKNKLKELSLRIFKNILNIVIELDNEINIEASYNEKNEENINENKK